MRLVEIKALPNGAHNSQTVYGANPKKFSVPEGWAIVHKGDGPFENFPFGSFETEVVDGLTYMKRNSWTPNVKPDPEPEAAPEGETSVWDELDAAYREGVDSV